MSEQMSPEMKELKKECEAHRKKWSFFYRLMFLPTDCDMNEEGYCARCHSAYY